jgi:hypothetical protein
VPTFRITYRPETGQPHEDIEADRVEVEGTHGMVVLRRQVLVMGNPRDIVVRRLPGATVASVDEAP